MPAPLETFLGAAALGLLTAIGVIAYRHPAAFKKLEAVLFWLVAGAMLLMAAFNFGILAGESAVSLEVAKTGDLLKIVRAVSSAGIPILLAYGVPAALFVYLAVLRSLPFWLLEKEKVENEDSKERH